MPPARRTSAASQRSVVEIDRRRLTLSNLDKVLYPRAGFTKAALLDYYARIAPAMVGHLAGRPVTFKRFPNGVEAVSFFAKTCPDHRPAWVRTASVRFDEQHAPIRFCLVEDRATLVWAANLAAIELHTNLALARRIASPTAIVFDLDPGAPAGLLECLGVALRLRELLAALGLESFAKTSGGKGLHLYVPINRPMSYERTRAFARSLAVVLARRHGESVTAAMRKDMRRGRVFVDWSQNSLHKSTVCAYSLRPGPSPTASTPITWREVELVHGKADADRLRFDPAVVLKRVEKRGDLFAPVLTLRQTLPRRLPSAT